MATLSKLQVTLTVLVLVCLIGSAWVYYGTPNRPETSFWAATIFYILATLIALGLGVFNRRPATAVLTALFLIGWAAVPISIVDPKADAAVIDVEGHLTSRSVIIPFMEKAIYYDDSTTLEIPMANGKPLYATFTRALNADSTWLLYGYPEQLHEKLNTIFLKSYAEQRQWFPDDDEELLMQRALVTMAPQIPGWYGPHISSGPKTKQTPPTQTQGSTHSRASLFFFSRA